MKTKNGPRITICTILITATLCWTNTSALSAATPKTRTNKKLGITFQYDPMLNVSYRTEHGNIVSRVLGIGAQHKKMIVQHEVSFTHDDPCSESGRHPTSKRITDFYVTMEISNETFDVFMQDILIIESDVEAGVPNYHVNVTYGVLKGIGLYKGNHGCGAYTYYFPTADNKMLVVNRYLTPEFTEVPEEKKEIYRRVKGIIVPEDEEQLFTEIMESLQLIGSH